MCYFEKGCMGHSKYEPPSQTALLFSTKRIGSLFISSIALNGEGCKSIAVCSNLGSDLGLGRRRWEVDQGAARFGACGATSEDTESGDLA